MFILLFPLLQMVQLLLTIPNIQKDKDLYKTALFTHVQNALDDPEGHECTRK
jgi:hypothetical protein